MTTVQTKPRPYCPRCGARMKLRRPKRYQKFDAFWGCSDYPDCRGARNIGKDGKPETDEEEW